VSGLLTSKFLSNLVPDAGAQRTRVKVNDAAPPLPIPKVARRRCQENEVRQQDGPRSGKPPGYQADLIRSPISIHNRLVRLTIAKNLNSGGSLRSASCSADRITVPPRAAPAGRRICPGNRHRLGDAANVSRHEAGAAWSRSVQRAGDLTNNPSPDCTGMTQIGGVIKRPNSHLVSDSVELIG
jgi:hypothetical protein